MTAAGDLRWRVRFEKRTEVEHELGGTTSGWDTKFTRYACLKPMRGGEGVQQQRLQGTQPVLIIVRRDSQTKLIDPSWRAVELLNNIPIRFYALKTAEDMERDNRFITMIGEQGAADGGDGGA